jgi:hypothetical protein
MNASDLDAVYTHLCRTMTAVGEERAPLFLARFALLAIDRLGDANVVRELTEAAAEGLAQPSDPAGPCTHPQ